MSTLSIVLLVITIILIAGIALLYFLGKKAQKKQAAQQEQIEAMKQRIPCLLSIKADEDKGCRASSGRCGADTKASARFQTPYCKSKSRTPDYDPCLR